MSGFQGPSGVKVNRRGGSTRQTFPFVPLIASQPVDLDPLPDNATPTQLAPPELPDRSTVSHNNEMAVHSPGIGSPHALFTTPTPAVRYPSPSYQKIPESPSFIYEPSVPSTAQPSPGRDLSHERGRTASKSRNKEKKCRNKKSAASKGVIAKVEELRTNQHLRDFPWKRFKGKFHAAVADTCIIELVDHLLDLCESKDSELQQLRETVNSLQEQSSSAPPRGNEISTDEPEIASADLADHSARSNIQLGSVDSSQDQAMSPPHLFGGMESATPADNFSEL
ncbi:hypothetical protein SISSUDRAFT_160988 [Sistotremastrum suecicum HHB10207 ss-3]|uniref:Uncharacterized protein n=1 Tax=Sistotremastrum suecicum HHB10207 ss-3 TaxID=1314776 RepID=A0A166AN64_9AGAM|nr:hypothetical protein SISSUDRAFT_160988 [Sistotremastrum suecicum HHB10207 ss-3]